MRLALVLHLLSPLTAGLAQDRRPEVQVGNARFRIPEGWQRVDQGTTACLSPKDLPAGKSVVLMILPAQPLGEGLKPWLGREWEGLLKTWKVESGGVPKTEKAGGVDVISVEARLAEKANPTNQCFTLIVGIQSADRVESFQFITNADELLPAHQKGVVSFMQSLSYAPAKSPEAPALSKKLAIPGKDLLSPSFTWGQLDPPKGTAGLDGLFLATLVRQTFDAATKRTTIRPEASYWAFFPDGRFYAALPEEGLENFKYDYWHKKNPEWCGTYTLAGGEGTLTYDDDRKTTVPLRKGADGIAIDGHGPYVPIDRCMDLRLEGTYRRSDWESLGGEESKKAHITFAKDGKFQEQGALALASAMWWRGEAGYLTDEGIPGSGSYRISNNSLSLLYEDGRKRRINVHLPKGVTREAPDSFVMNTWTFVRAK